MSGAEFSETKAKNSSGETGKAEEDSQLEFRGAYLNEPRGIPMVSRFRKDGLGMVTIAAGEEQVTRYMSAKSDEEYLAGESDLVTRLSGSRK